MIKIGLKIKFLWLESMLLERLWAVLRKLIKILFSINFKRGNIKLNKIT